MKLLISIFSRVVFVLKVVDLSWATVVVVDRQP